MNRVYVVKADLNAAGVKTTLPMFSELASQKTDVIIDLSEVEFIDGSGIGALAFIYKRLRSVGCDVKLINVRDRPLSVLKRLGLTNLLLSASSITRAVDGSVYRSNNASSDL